MSDAMFLHGLEAAMLAEALAVEEEYLDLAERHQAEGGLWGPAAERIQELRATLAAFRMFPPDRDWWQNG